MPVKPMILLHEDQLVGALRSRRMTAGISAEELDHRIGWPDAYTSKLEAPHRRYGRRALWGIAESLTVWLQGLGLALVLMDAEQAAALVAESEDPEIGDASHTPYPGRSRERPVAFRQVLRRTMTFTRSAA